jgi:hypothetical protein
VDDHIEVVHDPDGEQTGRSLIADLEHDRSAIGSALDFA